MRPVPLLVLMLLALLPWLPGCGGGGGGSDHGLLGGGYAPCVPSYATVPAAPAANAASVAVDSGPACYADAAYVTVTVCAPGTATCQSIDHVLLDTGSSGLRVLYSALNSSVAAALSAQSVQQGGQTLVECQQFVSGYTWGPLRPADVTLAQSEQLAAFTIQVIADPAFPRAPHVCSGSGPSQDSVDALGANGVLGIATQVADCGNDCTTPAGQYFTCIGSNCTDVGVPVATQVSNPVAFLPADNNGTVISLPDVPPQGAPSVTGVLFFGIATQGNNGLGGATVLTLSAAGNLNLTLDGHGYGGFFDTGSTLWGLPGSADAICGGYLCPAGTETHTAVLTGANGHTATVQFSIRNADALFSANPTFYVFDDLGAPALTGYTSSLDFGLPFFLGRTVFTAIEGRNAGGTTGPYVAF